jgi:hypothetical protein
MTIDYTHQKDIDLGAIVDVFAEADPGLRNPAVKREVVRRADALLREFEAEMAAETKRIAQAKSTPYSGPSRLTDRISSTRVCN